MRLIGAKEKMTTTLSLVLVALVLFPCLTRVWSSGVVRIRDGDMITVLYGKTLTMVKIRLYGNDCPERGQAFSKKVKRFASSIWFC